MTLKVRFFKNPYLEAYLPSQKGESSNQINKTKTLVKQTFRNKVLAHVQGYMAEKTIFKIKSPQMLQFIRDLIEKIKSEGGVIHRNYHLQIRGLRRIEKELMEMDEHDLTILRLPILNKKNPLIQILISLDDDMINQLSSISPPHFFPDFFETLSFHARLNQIESQRNSAGRIQKLISFSEDLIHQNNPSRSIQALVMAKQIANEHFIKFSQKIEFFRQIANAFSRSGDRNGAIAALADGIEFVSQNSPTEKQQIEYFQQIALDLIHFQAWDLLGQLFNVFTASSHLQFEKRNEAFGQILEQIFGELGWDLGLKFLYDLKNCIEKDLFIEALADAASKKPGWMDAAISMIKRIKNPEIQSRAKEMISERLPLESFQECEA